MLLKKNLNHILPIIFLFGECSSVIYRLNDTEYYKMPPVFHLDPYDACLLNPEYVYCTVDFALVSDTPSPLLNMIQEFSAFTSKHFNHTKLTYGLCVTGTCKRFYENTTADPKTILEACLNESMWDEYQLKTKLSDDIHCHRGDETTEIDVWDIIFLGILGIIVLFNVTGIIYEYYYIKGDNVGGNKFFPCFAICRNWKKLMAPSGEGPEHRLKLLKSINGMKAMGMITVIMAHSLTTSLYSIDNPRKLELLYDQWFFNVVLNGTTIVQTFFVISGFLLAYNIQLYAEKHRISWTMLPKGILLRWLRLNPPYALVLAYVVTWHRHAGSGPFWQKAAGVEITACRRDWWLHLLYMNNFIDGSDSMIHTWYLAADTQLYVLGLIVCIACKSVRSRTVVLSLLFLVGMTIPAILTFWMDLDGLILVTPDTHRYMYVKDRTYMHVYKHGYTNMASYIIGLSLGYIVYYAQKQGFDAQKYTSCLWIYRLMLPGGFALIISGMVFYSEDQRASVYLRMASAALVKPVFGLFIACGIAASVFKYENLYRNIMEWSGWTILSRLSYCAYIVHFPIVRYTIGSRATLVHLSTFHAGLILMGIVCLSIICAGILWLFIETPFGELIKAYLIRFEKPKPIKND